MNSFEVTFHLNNETVTINPIDYALEWNGYGQYVNYQDMYCDLLSILLNHKMSRTEGLCEYGTGNSWYYIYDYNGKKYRVWFYCDGQMYVQHIDEYYEPVDDMIGDYTSNIFEILNAIINDRP